MTSDFYTLTISEVTELTRESIAISFNVPDQLIKVFQFIQGQYLTLSMMIEGEEVRRCYSICCDVNKQTLQVGIKRVLDGVFSNYAMENFKDESFISQFLSPKVIRDFKLFALEDDTAKPFIAVSAIHDEMGYQIIKEKLSAQYNLSNLEPNIQVHNVDVRGDRSLTLRYIPQRGIPLGDSKDEVMRHLHRLWKFDVRLEQDNGDDGIDVISECKRAPQA